MAAERAHDRRDSALGPVAAGTYKPWRVRRYGHIIDGLDLTNEADLLEAARR
jgi:hypothetical protein